MRLTLTPLKGLAFLPNQISGLTLWLDGADSTSSSMTLNGSTVSTWKDKSGNGYDFTQSNASFQPTLLSNTLNGKSAVQFNATNTGSVDTNRPIMVGPTGANIWTADGSAFTVVFIGSSHNTSGGGISTILQLQGGSYYFCTTSRTTGSSKFTWTRTPLALSGTNIDTTANYFLLTYNGSGATTLANFTAINNGSAATPVAGFADTDFNFNALGGTYNGSGGGRAWGMVGYLAEWIFYNKVLSAGEQALINSYALSKWGL